MVTHYNRSHGRRAERKRPIYSRPFIFWDTISPLTTEHWHHNGSFPPTGDGWIFSPEEMFWCSKVWQQIGLLYSIPLHSFPTFLDHHFPYSVGLFPQKGKAHHWSLLLFISPSICHVNHVSSLVYEHVSIYSNKPSNSFSPSFLSSLPLLSSLSVGPLSVNSVLVINSCSYYLTLILTLVSAVILMTIHPSNAFFQGLHLSNHPIIHVNHSIHCHDAHWPSVSQTCLHHLTPLLSMVHPAL